MLLEVLITKVISLVIGYLHKSNLKVSMESTLDHVVPYRNIAVRSDDTYVAIVR